MPTYEYLCIEEACKNRIERICRIAEWTPEIECPICGGEMRHQIPRVAVHDDHPLWLDNNVRNQIQGDDGPPIETRKEYVEHCRKNGIVAS